jgi:Tol biopolymer transport system component
LTLPDDLRITVSGQTGRMDLSPDGRYLAFVASRLGARPRIWLRRLDSPEFRELQGTDGAADLTWSPDGRSIAFGSHPQFDVSPDGQRFLVNTLDREQTLAPPTVVINWTAALDSTAMR